MRLIDAEKLLTRLYDKNDVQLFNVHEIHLVLRGRVKQIIDEAPTVEASEVKHGKWEKGKCGNYFVCSECGQTSDFFKYDYCPGCGARMDGDKSNVV